MRQNKHPEVILGMLDTLCHQPDAVRTIAELLRVKEMGPADHIRTKHEIKAFVQSQNANEATELINRARARRESNRSAATRQTHSQRSSSTGKPDSGLTDFFMRSPRQSSFPRRN